MKKQLFSFALVLALVMTLTACGGNTGTPMNDGSVAGGTPNRPADSPQDNNPPTDLEETPVNDFEYKYDADTQGVMITKYTGTSIKVRIPDKIDDEPVTSIGRGAFSDSGIMSVYLPSTVKVIGGGAFSKCTGLTNIVIPNNVIEIGSDAFFSCEGLTSIVIPDSVTEIGSGAFRSCEKLTAVTIGNSVATIGNDAFKDCIGLTSIVIPNGVTEIGNGAFRNCKELSSIVIPDSVTMIGKEAFYGCSGLTSITLLDGLTSIGSQAFYGCLGLTSITLPDGLTRIGSKAFYGCTGLTTITIPDGVTNLEKDALALAMVAMAPGASPSLGFQITYKGVTIDLYNYGGLPSDAPPEFQELFN